MTLSPGLQRNSTEPAPLLETTLTALFSEDSWPKFRVPKVVTSLTPLPNTQPFTTVALTVNGWLLVKSLTPVSLWAGESGRQNSKPQMEARIVITN